MKEIIRSQYGASLAMLRGAVDACDGGLWTSADYHHPFWRVAYHALFFTDLYFSVSFERFKPWPKHVDELESLGPMIHKDGKVPKEGPPYTQEDVVAYWEWTREKMESAVEDLDLEAESGFFWLPFSKLELQFYNIRHLQHHTGQLIERIRQNLDKEVGWVAMK